MAKVQTQQSAGQVNQANQQVQQDVGNVVANQGGLQSRADTEAQKTLATSQGYVAPAADTYKEFAATGGFSPTDEVAFRNRATRGVAGTYQVLQDQANRQRAAAGGLGTGGEIVALGRHAGQDVAAANTDAEAALKQQENQNKLAGAGGLANLYGETNQLYNTQTGQITAAGQQILQALGLKYNTEEEGAAILANLSKNQGLLGNIQQGLGIASSALTGAFGASPSGKIGG